MTKFINRNISMYQKYSKQEKKKNNSQILFERGRKGKLKNKMSKTNEKFFLQLSENFCIGVSYSQSTFEILFENISLLRRNNRFKIINHYTT